MSCPHLGVYREGYRTFSPDVPGYAQGAYFPGGEPCYECELTGELCGNPNGNEPEFCEGQKEIDTRCPDCGGPINWTPIEVYYCSDCGKFWKSKDELLEEIKEREEYENEYAD